MIPRPLSRLDAEIMATQLRQYDPLVSPAGEITWQLPRERVTIRSRAPCEPDLTAVAALMRAARRDPWFQPPAAEAAGDTGGGEG